VTGTVLPATKAFPAPRIEDIGVLGVAGAGPADLDMITFGNVASVNGMRGLSRTGIRSAALTSTVTDNLMGSSHTVRGRSGKSLSQRLTRIRESVTARLLT
jgi:hypothetical protein